MDSLNIKTKQLNGIKNGRGIHYILTKAHEIMGNPVLVFDMEYNLITSSTSVINDDPIWCEFMTHGRLNYDTIEFFKNESFIDSVANCTQFDGVTYLCSSKLKYNRIFGQLYYKGLLPVADLVMVACEHPFEDYTPELIKTVCDIISKEISRDEYYHIYGQHYQENIITELIENNIRDKGVYSGHVSNIDRGLKSNIFIAVADVTQSNSMNEAPAYYKELFKQAEPEFKYATYLKYVVIILSSDNPNLQIDQDLKNLIHIFEQENINIGISSAFENLFELHKYYLEAIHALYDGKNAYNQQIHLFQ